MLRAKCPDAQIDQVDGARVLQEIECKNRGGEQGGQPERRERRVNQDAGADADAASTAIPS